MPILILLALCASLLVCSPVPAENRVLELGRQGDYVQLPANLFTNLEAATVEAWVKWEDWGLFSQWIAFGSNQEWRALGLNHFGSEPILQFFCDQASGPYRRRHHRPAPGPVVPSGRRLRTGRHETLPEWRTGGLE
jgi:hypothetical protein